MLIHDWRKVLKYSWTVRFIIAAGFLSGLEILLPFLEDWLQTYFHLPRWVYPSLMALITCAAVVARLLAQPKMHRSEKR